MEAISISVDAFVADMFCNHWHEFPRSIVKHMANVVNYDCVPDRLIVDVQEIRDVVRWDRMDKMKLIRVLIRCIDIGVDDFDKIKKNIQKHDYKVKDLTFLFSRRPEFIEFFPIDLDKVGTADAAMLLALGHEYFLDKIDLTKYEFNFRESMNIIVGYDFDRDIIEQVSYDSLKGYQVGEIMEQTGERDIDILDISTLTSIDWLNLLKHRPEMLKYCDYEKFSYGDIFYSIELCCMFEEPDLSHIVLSRNLNEISPLGWEMLLIEKPGKFLAHCNFDKLDDISWHYILKSHPELHVHRPAD